MDNMLKSEVVALGCGLEPRSAIDERRGVSDVVFLTVFTERYPVNVAVQAV